MLGKLIQGSPILWLLISIQVLSIGALSIPGSSGSSKAGLSSGTKLNSMQSQNSISGGSNQQQQQQQITTLPPLMTTISQNNYYDVLAQQHQQHQQQQQQQQAHSQSQSPSSHSRVEARSSNEDHDDSVPMATINNHSRNTQPAVRPPQYVDVSALVGRERLNSTTAAMGSQLNSYSSSGSSLPPASLAPPLNVQSPANGMSGGAAGSGASGLSPKSRSGLPECATQQVCNAIFVRMNYTQKLCECSSNYNWKCSHNLDPQDGHTIELTRKFDKRIYTQIKTCEPLREVRACKSPTDWTLLALQSERSGKAHYVVVCKCPTWAQLEGPYTHNHPPYANIPGIRVYGMLCAHQTARSAAQTYATYNHSLSIYPEFPWQEALNVLNTTNLVSTLESR